MWFGGIIMGEEHCCEIRVSIVIAARSVVTTAMTKVAGFDEMVSSSERRFYMLGGKGGVGKTSCAASLAVNLANHGHPTIVVSTDPAHSLSDSFDQVISRTQCVLEILICDTVKLMPRSMCIT